VRGEAIGADESGNEIPGRRRF